MGEAFAEAQKDEKQDESLQSLSKKIRSPKGNFLDCSESKSKILVKRVRSKCTLTSNMKHLQIKGRCMQELFLPITLGLNNRIPKHVVSLDEKFLRGCLELIHRSAAKATICDISINFSSFFQRKLISPNVITGRTETIAIMPSEEWNLGSITGTKSMKSTMKSTLFRQYGALGSEFNHRRPNQNDVGESRSSSNSGFPGDLRVGSSQQVHKTVAAGNHKYQMGVGKKRQTSTLSALSTSGHPSSSTSAQGKLQCTWKDGVPQLVFSVDDQKEVYIGSIEDKGSDYVYLFHSRKGINRKDWNDGLDLIGKMTVSFSFSLCPNNSEIIETEFVLFGSDENSAGRTHSGSQNRKGKGLSKKVVEAFKSNNSSKQRRNSKFSRVGSGYTLENDFLELRRDRVSNNSGPQTKKLLLENCLPANNELAAIVVKDHSCISRQQREPGGWGMKFLRKVGVKQNDASLEASMSSGHCPECTGDCSTRMDVLVPAGLHGGPKSRNAGPSSLIERWRSGGSCDCGGWDIGCPLTVLNAKSDKEEVLDQGREEGECQSFDLFKKGLERSLPSLKMVKVHDGLYFLHFQSTMSALQCFSIAVAILHSKGSIFRQKIVQKLM